MTQNQLNSLAMYNAVLNYLDENADTWTGIMPIEEKINELASTVANIHSKSQDQQEKSPAGFTAAKRVALDTMVQQAHKTALKVKGYANKIGDTLLLHSVDVSLHDLQNAPEKEIVNRCSLIAKAASANLANLADYKVTEETISNLNAAIEAASSKTARRDSVSGERRSITLGVPSLFSQARAEVLHLDDLIKGLIDETGQDFINGYFSVRRINNHRGARRKKEQPQQPVTNA